MLDGAVRRARHRTLWRVGRGPCRSRGPRCSSRGSSPPRPGERVLDLCAAPGRQDHPPRRADGATGARSSRSSAIPGRAAALERTVARMRASCVRVEVGDAADAAARRGAFDRILVDPPCSGLGTLQSRPDLRWRARPEAIGELAALQGRILAAGASALAPGGALVYSVCTISRAEGERRGRRLPASTTISRTIDSSGRAARGTSSSCCRTATAQTGSSSRAWRGGEAHGGVFISERGRPVNLA